MNYTYYTKGTCSKQIDLEINGDVITNQKVYMVFTGFCFYDFYTFLFAQFTDYFSNIFS